MTCSSLNVRLLAFTACIVSAFGRSLLKGVQMDLTNVAIIKNEVTQIFSPLTEPHMSVVNLNLGAYASSSAVVYNNKVSCCFLFISFSSFIRFALS